MNRPKSDALCRQDRAGAVGMLALCLNSGGVAVDFVQIRQVGPRRQTRQVHGREIGALRRMEVEGLVPEFLGHCDDSTCWQSSWIWTWKLVLLQTESGTSEINDVITRKVYGEQRHGGPITIEKDKHFAQVGKRTGKSSDKYAK